jgi:translation initiation factor 4A
MNANAKISAITKFRAQMSPLMKTATRVLVVYDVQVKGTEVPQVPFIVNYGEIFSLFLDLTINH